LGIDRGGSWLPLARFRELPKVRAHVRRERTQELLRVLVWQEEARLLFAIEGERRSRWSECPASNAMRTLIALPAQSLSPIIGIRSK